jgi:hypothetical protein
MSLAATGRGGRGQSATYGELESKPAAGIALSPGSAYLLCITGNYQRASMAERPIMLPLEQRREKPRVFPLLSSQELLWRSAENRRV